MTIGVAGEKSLSNRLFATLFISVFVSFLAATAIAAYVSWTVYEGDAEKRISAQLIATSDLIFGKSSSEMCDILADVRLAETRITLVAADGTVLYDSLVDAASMGNHASREEIRVAYEGAESVVLRKSETTGTDALYAAILVGNDGVVLRLAETRTSLTFYLGGLLVPLSLAILLATVLSALLARVITRRAAAPLLAIDLDAPLQSKTYREVSPLLLRIDAQRSELKSQNAQLEQAMEMRREFTGNVSHEMKSPLQVIGGYAELIENGITSPEDAKKFARLIRFESQSMRVLIDDVLMLSRLDERASGERFPIDVLEVVARVLERLRSSAETKGVQVVSGSSETVRALGSESLIEQTVYNLVDNAIRYGGKHVEVAVSFKEGMAWIAVSDDGPGVPDDQKARVFERFYRVDSSRSRSTGGTGLGLAIVKHAVESMGGRVSVGDSKSGGAEFIVNLPSA